MVKQSQKKIPGNIKDHQLHYEAVVNGIREAFANDPRIEIEQNKKIGSHNIDVAIKLKESDEIKLLVILDDDIKIDTYLKDKVTFIEDIDRQKYYEDRQYRTIRINKIE